MESEFIEAGIIANTHGIYGQVKLQPWADSPDFLTGFECYYIDGVPIKVLSTRVHKNNVIASLEGIDDIDTAIKIKNKIIFVKREDVKLEKGRYFVVELIGLCALDAETGEEIGVITDVLSLPSNEVYVIKGAREILVPAVPEFVIETNVEEGYVRICLIEGL